MTIVIIYSAELFSCTISFPHVSLTISETSVRFPAQMYFEIVPEIFKSSKETTLGIGAVLQSRRRTHSDGSIAGNSRRFGIKVNQGCAVGRGNTLGCLP